jgi:nitric oxide reductase subunit B
MKQHTIGYRFIVLGFICLLLSISFGLIASLQYIFPNLLADRLSFQQTRPLHVFLAVNWIFACVTGIMYQYMPEVAGKQLYSPLFAKVHFGLMSLTILIATVGFSMGSFSGREYLEFPPWVTIIIIAYWVLFCINFLRTVNPKLKGAPVYIWSWSVGLIFFLITIVEAHLWLLPFFNDNIIRDVTVQWKANGSMVGAWNMLIYGTAMFAMERITGKKEIGHQKTSFAFFFLGLTNLMFNWGHHTYIVPASPVVKEVSYIISMTELILFVNIIMKWKKGLLRDANDTNPLAKRFFMSADRWILLNLALAIAISVPYINQYTHGTQITVAHAMGATIGINTTLLLASVTFIFENKLKDIGKKIIIAGLRTMNVSLLLFWASLIAAGIIRSIATQQNEYFSVMTPKLLPYLRSFSVFGVFLVIGIMAMSFTYLRVIIGADRHSVKDEIGQSVPVTSQ